jgi:hypothetical protein
MPDTLADRVPVWAKPYAPTVDFTDGNFSNSIRVNTLLESSSSPQVVREEFSLKYPTFSNVTATNKKVLLNSAVANGVLSRDFSNEIHVQRPVGFFGVKLSVKGYKKEEVSHMRRFPVDSFPLGLISLAKNGVSVYAEKLQFSEQIVIANSVLQLLALSQQFGQLGLIDGVANTSFDGVNGILYYPGIFAEIAFLTVYELCIITFRTQF